MRVVLALVVVLALAVLGLAAGVGPYRLCQGLVDFIGDKLERQSRTLAGPRAVNCGRVERGHFASMANDCVRESLASGKAFLVRYGVQTIDSDISTGLVRSPQGRLYEIILDGNSGRAGPTSLLRQRITVQECSSELRVTYGGRLSCLPDRGF